MSKALQVIANAVDVVPVVYARPLLTPPPSKADVPLYAYACPYCSKIKLVTEPLTIWPALAHCRSKPIMLLRGAELFVGEHLLGGYPDKLPERLMTVLNRVREMDEAGDGPSRWVAIEAVYSSWTPPPPKVTTGLFALPPRPPMPKRPVADTPAA